MVVSVEWHQPARDAKLFGQMKPVDGVEEKEGANALVEVVARPPKGIELAAFVQERLGAEIVAAGVQRRVARRGIFAEDDVDQL